MPQPRRLIFHRWAPSRVLARMAARPRAAMARVGRGVAARWRSMRQALAGAVERKRPRSAGLGLLPAWSWLLVGLVTACMGALGWYTWEADRLVARSVSLQREQIAAWDMASLQRRLLRLEAGVGTASAVGAVRDEAGLRGDLAQAMRAGAALRQGATREGLQQLPEWQPLLRRTLRLLAYIEREFPAFLDEPSTRGPALLTGLREVGRLTEELSVQAYTANTQQAAATMSALGTVQRYLAVAQALLVVLLGLLAAAVWFSVRSRLRAAYEELAAEQVVQAELRQAKEEAEAANRIKSDFLASMSHELRTPLTGLLGYCRLVLRKTYGPVSKRIREPLERVEQQGEHLLHLVNDVLDLSRIEAGRMALDVQPWPPAACIADAVARMDALAQEKGLRLEAAPDETLPPWPYDRLRITQVLVNLISNAIKFTEEGHVEVGVEAHPDGPRYRVADTGRGIAPERLPTLFTEFQQGDAYIARAAPGAGLGLAICRHIVELHGGRIWVESRVGSGSTFWFSLGYRGDDG